MYDRKSPFPHTTSETGFCVQQNKILHRFPFGILFL